MIQEFSELVLQREDETTETGLPPEYSIAEILPAIRRACLSLSGVPVLCGASLRGIGVEPLLDCVTSFLPSPLDRPQPTGVIRGPTVGRSNAKGGKRRGKKAGKGCDLGGGVLVAGEGAREGGGEGVRKEVVVDPLQDDLVAFVFKVSYL